MSSRAKKKGRGNPLKDKTESLPTIVYRDVKPQKGESLGFGRDRARKYGSPTPTVQLPSTDGGRDG